MWQQTDDSSLTAWQTEQEIRDLAPGWRTSSFFLRVSYRDRFRQLTLNGSFVDDRRNRTIDQGNFALPNQRRQRPLGNLRFQRIYVHFSAIYSLTDLQHHGTHLFRGLCVQRAQFAAFVLEIGRASWRERV